MHAAWALPNELILEIAAITCANSQSDYRTCLLLSRGFYQAIRLQCIQYVPIQLHSSNAIESFARLLQTHNDIAPYVRHLWTISSNKSEIQITRACTSLVTLACQSALLTSICSSPTFAHNSLRELTIMTIWSPWEDVIRAPHGEQLCSQITHLRHFEGLPPDFPPSDHFISLKSLSFSSHIYRDFLVRHLSRLGEMPSLQNVVITTSWHCSTGVTPGDFPKMVQQIDKRLQIVTCERGFSEKDSWSERSRLGNCLWSTARTDKIVSVGPREPTYTPYN